MPTRKWIDTHHHIVPDFYAKAVGDAGGDPTGWPTPQWSIDSAHEFMKSLGVDKAIASVTSPGATILPGEPGRKLARQLNEFSHKLVQDDPEHFAGFFAALPSFNDIDAALQEIEYAFTNLSPAGVIVYTSYSLKKDDGKLEWRYLGHPAFAPIWEALAKHDAVVFIHPSDTPSVQANDWLLPPVTEYPHESARTAADLVQHGVVTKYPNLHFILSHSGGTLPMLTQRIAMLPGSPIPPQQALAAFSSFYFDVAISTSPAQLKALQEITTTDHILFGSDTPYAPAQGIHFMADQLEQVDAQLLAKVTRDNVTKLFPKLFSH